MGRKRTKNLRCPPGVIPRGDRWYWQPTSKRERDERRRKGEPLCVTLGKAGSPEARRRWAELSGFRDPLKEQGLLGELLSLWEQDGLERATTGQPRAKSTVKAYRRDLKALRARWGAVRYASSAEDVARGKAVGTSDLQRWVREGPPILANRRLAVLSNVFDHAITEGRTTYNPCRDVVKNPPGVRDREAEEWEVECLRTMASPLLRLLVDFEGITGWRIGDILALTRAQLAPAGIRLRHQKKGRRQLWEWTPELRRIVAEAEELPGASRFPASPVFPSRRGKRIPYGTFDHAWQDLKRATNAALAACEVPLEIADLHFHDLRSKAHDDAEEAGMQGNDFLGNTAAVARKHYRRREQKVRPIR